MSPAHIPANEPAVLQVMEPYSAEIIEAWVLHPSMEGINLQLGQQLLPGWNIKVRLPDLTIFGEVLGCKRSGDEYCISVRIIETIAAD